MTEAKININLGDLSQASADTPERVLSLIQLKKEDIQPGTIISGLESRSHLQALINHFAWVLEGSTAGSNAFNNHTTLQPVGDKLLEQARKRRFNGALQNFEVTMLPPEMSPGISRSKENPYQLTDHSLAFVVGAEMHSSGRGVIGIARRICGMHLTELRVDSLAPYPCIAHTVNIVSREFAPASFRRSIDDLIKHSSLVAGTVLEENLRNAFRGGLPSSGKRRK